MQNRTEYLDAVCEQIRFKAARKSIKCELGAHIDDRIAEGKTEEQAIAVMGDAFQTGQALNRIHKPRFEWRVVLCMLLLSAMSAALSVMTTKYGSYVLSESLFYEIIRPMIQAFFLMAVLYFFNYALLRKLRFFFYTVSMLYLIAYILMYDPFNDNIWLAQTPVIILSTLALILGMVGLVSKGFKNRVVNLVVLSLLSIVSITLVSLVMFENALLLSFVYVFVFIVAKWKNRKQQWMDMAVYSIVLIAAFVICTQLFDEGQYAFISKIENSHYTDINAMLQKAKLIGSSTINLGFGLPSSRIHYVITAIIGAYGWLAGIGATLIAGALCTFMLRRSLRVAHSYGRLLSAGISVFFTTRVVLLILTNIGVIDGAFSMPFLSFGRYEYLSDAILMGIFLSVWRRSTFMSDEAKVLMKET